MKEPSQTKPTYSLLQNIGYSLSRIWTWDKGYFLAFVPMIPASIFLPLAAVYFPKLLIDLIERKSDDATLLAAIASYCLLLTLAGLLRQFCDARIHSTNYTFSIQCQHEVSRKSMTMDYENVENPKIQDMTQYTYGGGMSLENMAKELNGLLTDLLGFASYGSIIGLLSPVILLVLIVSSVLYYLTMRYARNYADKNRDNWVKLDRKNGYLSRLSSEYDRAKDIKLYRMQDWLSALMEQCQKLRMVWFDKVANRDLLVKITDGFLRFVRDSVAYFILISMFLGGSLDLANFVFYFGAIAGFSGWLLSLANRFQTIFTYNVEINRLRAYLDLPDRFRHGDGAPLPARAEAPFSLSFDNVSYVYPESARAAVDGVSFTIKPGERIAVVGENGAGKTTLVKLLCGLYYPTSGTVLLNGRDIREYAVDEYYTLFSAVFQEVFLIPFSVSDFVASGAPDTDAEAVTRSLSLAGLGRVVEALPKGVRTMLVKGVYEDGVDLSGGEKQKLLLARALYKDGPIVVLDEPTAALDPIAESELYEKYAGLTEGKTSVYISHRLASTRFCDRIFFIKDGKIAECGSHGELMAKKGLYANMFDIQSHYYKEGVRHEA